MGVLACYSLSYGAHLSGHSWAHSEDQGQAKGTCTEGDCKGKQGQEKELGENRL